MTAPRVFISHASEDKERFVVPFAAALRQRGVDAWLDQWEMMPGDSLVDKIFEDGIAQASVVIIVLSETSVAKPWVRQELNVAVVKRIDEGTKLIPIVLDRCEVPTSLKSTVWQGVPDPSDFAACLDRVVDAIFGHSRKPPIGAPASYLSPGMPSIAGLSAADSLLLSVLYEQFLELGRRTGNPEAVLDAMSKEGVEPGMTAESLAILEHLGYADSLKATGRGFKPCGILPRGVSAVLGAREAGLVREVGLAILNGGHQRGDAIAEAIGQPQPLAEHAMELLARSGHVVMSGEIGPVKRIGLVQQTLRRALDGAA